MSKYFGEASREDFIDECKAGHLWIFYKDSCYVITEDGRGFNLIPQNLKDGEVSAEYMHEHTISAPTIEELIDVAVFYDGVTLGEALEMDL